MKISLQNSYAEEYRSVCSHSRGGGGGRMKYNLLCHGFSIVSRSFCVMIRSLVCGSQTLLTTVIIRERGMMNRSCCPVSQNLGV